MCACAYDVRACVNAFVCLQIVSACFAYLRSRACVCVIFVPFSVYFFNVYVCMTVQLYLRACIHHICMISLRLISNFAYDIALIFSGL